MTRLRTLLLAAAAALLLVAAPLSALADIAPSDDRDDRGDDVGGDQGCSLAGSGSAVHAVWAGGLLLVGLAAWKRSRRK